MAMIPPRKQSPNMNPQPASAKRSVSEMSEFVLIEEYYCYGCGIAFIIAVVLLGLSVVLNATGINFDPMGIGASLQVVP